MRQEVLYRVPRGALAGREAAHRVARYAAWLGVALWIDDAFVKAVDDRAIVVGDLQLTPDLGMRGRRGRVLAAARAEDIPVVVTVPVARDCADLLTLVRELGAIGIQGVCVDGTAAAALRASGEASLGVRAFSRDDQRAGWSEAVLAAVRVGSPQPIVGDAARWAGAVSRLASLQAHGIGRRELLLAHAMLAASAELSDLELMMEVGPGRSRRSRNGLDLTRVWHDQRRSDSLLGRWRKLIAAHARNAALRSGRMSAPLGCGSVVWWWLESDHGLALCAFNLGATPASCDVVVPRDVAFTDLVSDATVRATKGRLGLSFAAHGFWLLAHPAS